MYHFLDNHPHPRTGETLPVVFGHEISGTVEAIVDKGFRQLREDTENHVKIIVSI